MNRRFYGYRNQYKQHSKYSNIYYKGLYRMNDGIMVTLMPGVKEEDIEIQHYNATELELLWVKAKQGKLTSREQLLLVNYAKFSRSWIMRFRDLFNLMLGKSHWTPKIQKLIDEFDYGTPDEKVIAAAKEYLKRHR